MQEWLAIAGLVALCGAMMRLLAAFVFDEIGGWRSTRMLTRWVRRLRRSRTQADVVPLGRPVEQVAADLRRLRDAFHRGDVRFAKYEGCRRAYDAVLAEAADMVGVTHLIGLLPPGVELDRERERIEWLLEQHGLLPPRRAA